MNDIIMRVEGIEKRFPGREPLFKNLKVSFKRGGLYIVYGRSGSGKSTLLQILLGFETWDTGEIYFEDDLLRNVLKKRPEEYRKSVGYMSQNNLLTPELTILENIMMPIFEEYNWKERLRKSLNLMKELEIEDLHNRYIDQISGGQMRRANLAFALIKEPRVLLLDEPTSNLHSQLGNEIFQLICRYSEKNGTTVIMATHDRSLVNDRATYLELESRDQP